MFFGLLLPEDFNRHTTGGGLIVDVPPIKDVILLVMGACLGYGKPLDPSLQALCALSFEKPLSRALSF